MKNNQMLTHQYGCDFHISFRRINNNDADMLSNFDCGNKSINYFIRSKSLGIIKDVTYIFVDDDNGNIIAFCSICCNGIWVNQLNKAKNKEYTTNKPAVEIDFFAVDERYRSIPWEEESGRYDTLSNALFSYMIKYIHDVVLTHIGATHICLYAVPRAKSFYKRCGFKEFESYMNPDGDPYIRGCIPMFMPLE